MDLPPTSLRLSTGSEKYLPGGILGGALYLTLARFLAQATHYGIHIGLGRLFPPALYGYFGILASTFSLMEVTTRWGVSRTASFYIAQDEKVAREILKKSLGLQTLYA